MGAKICIWVLYLDSWAHIKRLRDIEGMSGCLMQKLTRNNAAQQQDAVHRRPAAGVRCTLLRKQWDEEEEGDPLEQGRWRGGEAFFFSELVAECGCRLDLLFGDNGQSKH